MAGLLPGALTVDAAVAYEPMDAAHREVLPLVVALRHRLGREGQVEGRDFFRRVESGLRDAGAVEDLAPPLMDLATTAFALDTRGFSPASLRLLDQVLERAHALAIWLAVPEPPLD